MWIISQYLFLKNGNWKSKLQNTIIKEYHLNVHMAILYMAKDHLSVRTAILDMAKKHQILTANLSEIRRSFFFEPGSHGLELAAELRSPELWSSCLSLQREGLQMCTTTAGLQFFYSMGF